jgi:hypothetical protein
MHRALALAVALLLPVAALAGDVANVGGTYEGKMNCRGLANGVPTKGKEDVTLLLLQTGSDFQASIGDAPMAGYAVVDTSKPPVTAEVLLTSCFVSGFGLTGNVLEGSIKVKPNDKSKLTGDLIRFNRETFDLEVCNVTLSRTNAAAPTPVECPPI